MHNEMKEKIEMEDDGAINEKKRLYNENSEQNLGTKKLINESDFDPSNILSHQLHALVGLDRYPNYLSRWSSKSSLDDITKLEKSFENVLEKIRHQKELIQEKKQMLLQFVEDISIDEENKYHTLLQPPTSWEEIQEYILDPRASKAIFQSKWFTSSKLQSKVCVTPPTVEQVLNGEIDIHLDAMHLENWLDQEMFDVYSFPLLSKKFSKRIKSFLKQIKYYANRNTVTNSNKIANTEASKRNMTNIHEKYHLISSLNQRPIDLDTIGLGWINSLLFQLVIRPLSRHLFQDTEIHGDLDWRQGYVSTYTHKQSSLSHVKTHSRLVPHTDDSEVTLNLCLGDPDFVGGEVQFSGLRGTSMEGVVLGSFQPVVGTALLHAGRHLHEVTEVMHGNRYAYIIWARSWNGVRSFTCPCCWLNRRTNDENMKSKGRKECICSPKWN